MNLKTILLLMTISVFGNLAFAQSGYQTINGTRVFTQVYQDQGYAVFSNECGSQRLTQAELQAGAIPNNIIPCPRPNQTNSSSAYCQQVSRDFEYQMSGRKMSDAWKRALICIPGLMCNASCTDLDEYGRVLQENRAIERKWVFDCNGFVTTINGQRITRANFDAHHDEIYSGFLKKRNEVCASQRTNKAAGGLEPAPGSNSSGGTGNSSLPPPSANKAMTGSSSPAPTNTKMAVDETACQGLRRVADTCFARRDTAASGQGASFTDCINSACQLMVTSGCAVSNACSYGAPSGHEPLKCPVGQHLFFRGYGERPECQDNALGSGNPLPHNQSDITGTD